MDYMEEMLSLGDQYVTARLGNIKEIGDNPVDEVVTTTDLSISEELLDVVRERFPLSFTEESLKENPQEAERHRQQRGCHWGFDPIDGSLELKARDAEIRRELVPAPNCSVWDCSGMIAALFNPDNRPVAMISYTSKTKTFVHSTLNEGPFVEVNEELQLPTEPKDKIVGVQRTVVRLKRLKDFYEFLAEREGKDLEIVQGGGPGAMATKIVTEGINVYVNSIASNWKEWDTMGIDVIAQRLSGRITDIEGNTLKYIQADPKRHKGMVISLSEHIGLSYSNILDAVNEFADKYGHLLLEPDKRDGISVYEHYKECLTDPAFMV